MAIQIHYQDDTRDHERDYGKWSRLLLNVSNAPKPMLRLRTAAGKRMRLDAGDLPILWAQIDGDYYEGVHVYRSLPQHQEWLPSISSAEVQKIALMPVEQQKKRWLKYFVQALHETRINCLSDGLWSLEYCDGSQSYEPHWRGKHRLRDWHAGAGDEDFQLLQAPCVYLDWCLSGSGQILNVFAPQARDSGRIKWWRKLARLGQTPPILVWYIHSLSAYMILDGHDRLQACLLEGVQPAFAVLTSFYEVAIHSDPGREQAILHQVNLTAERIAKGTENNPASFVNMQKLLAQAFDRRPMRRFITRSSATLDPQAWDDEVAAFMRQKAATDCIYLRGL
ncbi:ParB/Srx family N-terminal domain-containing protein [Undibacterium sp. Tian12W]|uniref:ParB/Srx family N-terminal domain-containing protein n=1 Tax=Undibacterium sp. Tian12W TaxID=3413054 RepID=UPI003BF06A60